MKTRRERHTCIKTNIHTYIQTDRQREKKRAREGGGRERESFSLSPPLPQRFLIS